MFKRIAVLSVLLYLVMISQASACTIFTASKGGKTLAGNNEDFPLPGTNVWFIPASEGKFGRVYFGIGASLPQGGMNEKGLFSDCAALPPKMDAEDSRKERFDGNLIEKALEECSTVNEALVLFDRYNLTHMYKSVFNFQIMLADKTGDSAIIEGDTVIRKSGDYQIATNFRHSLDVENPYSIERYTKVENMLNGSDELSVVLFRSILDGAHQSHGSMTQYSNIYDLQTGDIYLYHFHDFETVVKFNLHEELKKDGHSHEILEFFPETSPEYKALCEKFGKKVRTEVTANPAFYDEFIGEYQITPGFSITVTKENGALFARMRGQSKYEIIPESAMSYFYRDIDALFTFVRNDEGQIDSLKFTFFGNEIPAKKIN
ncbi:MAG: DUF3471 domain-containing protein [Candidatus Latescibacteria bacterium]|nr:DUF3471 domain-containing protein [Candidatus Latescibacterota bacterium]